MNLEEVLWYQNFDWSMIWVCIGAVIVHILYLATIGKTKDLKWTHYLFYLTSSLLLLSFISEVASYVLAEYTSFDKVVNSGIKHFLAAISGLGGSYIITALIKKVKTKII